MTEAAEDRITLIPNAIYGHYGVVRIAVDENYLVDVCGTDGTKHLPTSVTELLEKPGEDEWVDRMVRIRRTLITELKNNRAEVQRLDTWKRDISQAIFEKALEKEWCEEYDEFAAEWDLPLREREFEVTVAVRVTAPDENAAKEIVRDCVNIDKYSTEGIDEDPEYYVSQV